MICLNSGGNLVRSQVEERGLKKPSDIGPGHGDPAFSFTIQFRHSREPEAIRSGEATTVRATVPGTTSIHTRVRHRRESSRTEPSLHLGRRSQDGQASPGARLRRPNAWTENPRKIANPTLRRAWPRDLPGAAICVQDVDVQCVLQFTLIHAAGCALHRHTSRVIHRLELSVTAKSSDDFVPGAERHRKQERETNLAHPATSSKQ